LSRALLAVSGVRDIGAAQLFSRQRNASTREFAEHTLGRRSDFVPVQIKQRSPRSRRRSDSAPAGQAS
jgi:hypothetical protein